MKIINNKTPECKIADSFEPEIAFSDKGEQTYPFELEEMLPDTESCPVIFEWDNPEYSLEKTADAVSICAETVFGIPVLYPWQRLVIANILDAVHAAEAAEAQGQSQLSGKGEPLSELYDEDGVSRGRQIVLLPTGAGK